MITLNAYTRDVKVNPKMIRKEAKIPAVFYGPGHASTPISVDRPQFEKVLKQAGESTVITLKLEKESIDALIHDVDVDPVIGDPIHIDFYVVAKDRKVEVQVPIQYIGVAPAEKLGGVVVKVMHELHVSSLPSKLPHEITIDLSTLTDMDSDITVADLKLPEGVTVAGLHPEDVIASITAQAKEEETLAPALDLSKIEVEKKGKKEGEEDAAE